MKKTLFLSVFLALVLTVPSVSFGAVRGCEPSFAFSPLTGERCSDLPIGCEVGYLFSAVTGKPCIDSNKKVEYNKVMSEETKQEEEVKSDNNAPIPEPVNRGGWFSNQAQP